MPLLKTEADKLSNNLLVSGVIEEIIEKEELYALLPFVGISGKSYVYNRETGVNVTDGGAGSPQWVDPNDIITEGATTFQEVTTRLRILAGDVDVDKFIQETESDTNNQKAEQILAKAKALGHMFKNALVNGNSTNNTKEFDGIDAMTTTGNQNYNASQIVTGNGALTLGMLDELVDAVPNKPDCLMMRSGTMRAYRALMRAAGGNAAPDFMIKDFGMVMAHNGVPIIINDFISKTEGSGNACSVYAMRLNPYDGLHGLYGGASAGIRVEEIGTVQNKDATRTRLKWYAGLALKSTRSLARLTGITNV